MPPLFPPPSFTQQIVMNLPRNLRHWAKHCISGFYGMVFQGSGWEYPKSTKMERSSQRVELNEMSVMYEDPPCTHTDHPPAQVQC